MNNLFSDSWPLFMKGELNQSCMSIRSLPQFSDLTIHSSVTVPPSPRRVDCLWTSRRMSRRKFSRLSSWARQWTMVERMICHAYIHASLPTFAGRHQILIAHYCRFGPWPPLSWCNEFFGDVKLDSRRTSLARSRRISVTGKLQSAHLCS